MKRLHTEAMTAAIALLSVCLLPNHTKAEPAPLVNRNNTRFALASYGSTGSTSSTAITDFTSSVNEEVHAVAAYPGGKVVAAGAGHTNASGIQFPYFAVARYTSTGSLDTTFASGGKAMLTNAAGKANAVAVHDGKVILAGYTWSLLGGGWKFQIVRLTATGTLDTSFGSNGIVITDFSTTTSEWANAITIQPADGKIVVTGEGRTSTDGNHFVTARYHSNGTLDTSFNGSGKAVANFPSSANEGATAVAVQPSDNKIVAAGWAVSGGRSVFAIVRYNTNGTLDTTFAGGGTMTDFASSSDDKALTVRIVGGKILVAGRGEAQNCPSGDGLCTIDYYLAVARYNLNNGSLDTTFGAAGKAVRVFAGWLSDVAITADSKFVAVGEAGLFAIARYTGSVTLDTTFDGDGRKTTNLSSDNEWANAVAIDASTGKIIAAGGAADSPVVK